MSHKPSVHLVPLLRRLLDLQVAHENKDSEKREELEALGWPPWETAEQVATRRGTPWDHAAELVFAEFHRKGKDINKQGLREHLLLRRLAGLLLQAPLPTDGKTGREFQAALPTVPLGGVEEVSDLSAELARLNSEGFGDVLAERLRQSFPEGMTAILDAPPTGAGDSAPTIWFHAERQYSMDRLNPLKVSDEFDSILQAFLESQAAMETNEIEERAGVTNAPRAMQYLAEWNEGTFKPAIRIPGGKAKGGYFIRVKRL
jgi:hypothetical protein